MPPLDFIGKAIKGADGVAEKLLADAQPIARAGSLPFAANVANDVLPSAQATSQLLKPAANATETTFAGTRITGIPNLFSWGQSAERADALSNTNLTRLGILKEGIPEHLPDGTLAPGLYRTNWQGFVKRLGFNEHRLGMLDRTRPLFKDLHDLGADDLYIGGSFVRNKINPADIDAIAALRIDQPSRLWQRVSNLSFVTNEHGEHMLLSHAEHGYNAHNFELFRHLRPGKDLGGKEVGMVKLDLKDSGGTLDVPVRELLSRR